MTTATRAVPAGAGYRATQRPWEAAVASTLEVDGSPAGTGVMNISFGSHQWWCDLELDGPLAVEPRRGEKVRVAAEVTTERRHYRLSFLGIYLVRDGTFVIASVVGITATEEDAAAGLLRHAVRKVRGVA